jgi:hypothetical protein
MMILQNNVNGDRVERLAKEEGKNYDDKTLSDTDQTSSELLHSLQTELHHQRNEMITQHKKMVTRYDNMAKALDSIKFMMFQIEKMMSCGSADPDEHFPTPSFDNDDSRVLKYSDINIAAAQPEHIAAEKNCAREAEQLKQSGEPAEDESVTAGLCIRTSLDFDRSGNFLVAGTTLLRRWS